MIEKIIAFVERPPYEMNIGKNSRLFQQKLFPVS